MRTVSIIYNAHSGRDNKKELVQELIAFLIRNGFDANDITDHAPRSADHAFELAKYASQQHVDLIIAIGGDGTINKIAGGIFAGGANSTLAIIPAGTVNNFAKSLQFSTNLPDTFDYLINGEVKAFDLCKVNQTYMISSLTIGILADIAAAVKPNEKRKLGPLAFLKNMWPILQRNRTYYLTMTIDQTVHKIKTKFLLITATNAVGGITSFHPSASADDGVVRIYTMENYHFWRFFHYWWSIRAGEFKHLPEIHYFKGKHITIQHQKRALQSARTRIDGDKSTKLPIELTVLPKVIRVLVPSTA